MSVTGNAVLQLTNLRQIWCTHFTGAPNDCFLKKSVRRSKNRSEFSVA